MKQLKNATISCFDGQSHYYDIYQNLVVPEYKTALHITAMTLARYVGDIGNVLDLGCGTGNVSIEILRKCPKIKIFLVDGSTKMLNCAKKKILSVVPNATSGYNVADLSDKAWHRDLQGEYFDCIVSTFVLEHLTFSQYRNTLNACYSLLKSGGWLITVEAYKEDGTDMLEWYEKQMNNNKRMVKDMLQNSHVPCLNSKKETHYYSSKAQKQLWWKRAGFQQVHVVWQYLPLALMTGRKP